jgi:hypothetical protein
MPRNRDLGEIAGSLELPPNVDVGSREFLRLLNARFSEISRLLDKTAGGRGVVALSADLNLNGNRIINVGAARDSGDAVSLSVGNRRYLINPVAPSTTSVAAAAASAREKKMTFGIGIETPLVVGTSLTNWGEPNSSGTPFRISIACKTPPATQNLILDIYKSSNNGSSWTSLFSSKPTYPIGTPGRLNITSGFVSLQITELVDLLRIDCLQTDGVCQDCEVVLEWN